MNHISRAPIAISTCGMSFAHKKVIFAMLTKRQAALIVGKAIRDTTLTKRQRAIAVGKAIREERSSR